MDRPAEDDPPRRRPRRKAEPIAHVLADERDQLLEGVVLRADAGAFERPIREVGLQRLDEAALGLRREIALDRLRPGDRRLPRLEVQHRRKRRARPVRGGKLREPRSAVGDRRTRRRCWWCRNRLRPNVASDIVTLRSHPTEFKPQRHRDTEIRERTLQIPTRRTSTGIAGRHARIEEPRERKPAICRRLAFPRLFEPRCRRRRRATRSASVSRCLRGFVNRTGARLRRRYLIPAAAPPSRRPRSRAGRAASWRRRRRAAGSRARRRTPAG